METLTTKVNLVMNDPEFSKVDPMLQKEFLLDLIMNHISDAGLAKVGYRHKNVYHALRSLKDERFYEELSELIVNIMSKLQGHNIETEYRVILYPIYTFNEDDILIRISTNPDYKEHSCASLLNTLETRFMPDFERKVSLRLIKYDK